MKIDFEATKVGGPFLADDTSDVKLLHGPVGSCKTSHCLMNIMKLALSIKPCYDGVRRSRWAIVRNTWSELKTTTLQTWLDWFPPEEFASPKGQYPIEINIIKKNLDIQLWFLALDKYKDVRKMRSMEITAGYLNEAQYMLNPLLAHAVYNRTMRYPGKKSGGGLGRPLLLMDCNPPPRRHWIYKIFEQQKRRGWKSYKMQSALIKMPRELSLPRDDYAVDATGQRWMNNPEADYIQHAASPTYWLKQAEGRLPAEILVDLCGEYGTSLSGTPVYSSFNESIHVWDSPLEANPLLPLCLGFDFGNTPACAIIQRQTDNTLYVLDEFPTEKDYLRPFLEDTVIPALDSKYPWWRENHMSRHDPSDLGTRPTAQTASDILREFGIKSLPCESNNMDFRRDSLQFYFGKMYSGHPAILFSPTCPILIEGLAGEFQYEYKADTLLDATPVLREKPKKNYHSHICEALEYATTAYRQDVKQKDTSDIDQLAQSHMRNSKVRAARWKVTP